MNPRLRMKVLAKTEPFVPAGEAVQAAFGASTRTTWWMYLALVPTIIGSLLLGPIEGIVLGMLSVALYVRVVGFRTVVVTPERILVLESTRWTQLTPAGVLRELPRATPIGTPTGTVWRCETLGESLWIPRAFHSEVDKVSQRPDTTDDHASQEEE